MGRLGLTELLVIAGVAMLLFGSRRISDIGKGLGDGIRSFKKGLRDEDEAASPEVLPLDDPGSPRQVSQVSSTSPSDGHRSAAAEPGAADPR